jgi:hypothetical protein
MSRKAALEPGEVGYPVGAIGVIYPRRAKRITNAPSVPSATKI